jgi:hypothetical protein
VKAERDHAPAFGRRIHRPIERSAKSVHWIPMNVLDVHLPTEGRRLVDERLGMHGAAVENDISHSERARGTRGLSRAWPSDHERHWGVVLFPETVKECAIRDKMRRFRDGGTVGGARCRARAIFRKQLGRFVGAEVFPKARPIFPDVLFDFRSRACVHSLLDCLFARS